MFWLLRCFKFGWPLVIGLVIISLALGTFAGLATQVYERQAIGFDTAILNALFSSQSPTLTAVMQVFTTSATFWVMGPLIIVLAVAWWRNHPADIIALVTSVMGAFALNNIVKLIFERARPTIHPALVHALGYSFPSGHSQAAMAFYGVLAYLIARRLPPGYRLVPYVVAGAWIVLVGLSRNYLEVHYPSDVLAAFAITVPWVLAVIFVHQCYSPRVPGQEKKVIEPA
jgi:undecaprenyl-diphosphatase